MTRRTAPLALVLAGLVAGFAHAALTIPDAASAYQDAPGSTPTREWCVIYAEGEVDTFPTAWGEYCDENPELTR